MNRVVLSLATQKNPSKEVIMETPFLFNTGGIVSRKETTLGKGDRKVLPFWTSYPYFRIVIFFKDGDSAA